MNNRNCMRYGSVFLCLLVVTFFAVFLPVQANDAIEGPVWRMDTATPQTLRNVRVDEKLHILGSSQPTMNTIHRIPMILESYDEHPVIWDIDLRQESHGYLNGVAVSWYGKKNTLNARKTAAMVENDEWNRLQEAVGTDITVVPIGTYDRENGAVPKEIQVHTYMTERDMAKKMGMGYIRIAATDRQWPEPQAIDEFISFYRSLPSQPGWLYFHCHAGHGRTTIFMTLYELLKKPDETVQEASIRQHALGGADLFQANRQDMLEKFRQYVKENRSTGYRIPWSQWLISHEKRTSSHTM